MNPERRRAPRQRVSLGTYLESGPERHGAVIVNLSPKGCFVLTQQELQVGAAVKIELGKPGLLHMTLEGAVVHHSRGRGVGVRFKDLTVTQQALLMKLTQNIK